jgi:hypothetical protein
MHRADLVRERRRGHGLLERRRETNHVEVAPGNLLAQMREIARHLFAANPQ